VKKFGVYVPVQQDGENTKAKKGKSPAKIESIKRFTDKMYSPDIDVTYPEFTSQHFSPNRQE